MWESGPSPRATSCASRIVPRAWASALYVAVAGGIDVPPVLGSRATYTMGGARRARGTGARCRRPAARVAQRSATASRVASTPAPEYAREWEIRAMRGPQSAPDFLTEPTWSMLFSRSWAVEPELEPHRDPAGARHVRVGAPLGGGIAGGHPSNILDNGYPVGALNINGDLPVILGLDGPTVGGFVVAATVIHAAIWKLGQIRPGTDRIRFVPVSLERAVELDRALDAQIGAVAA